MLHPGKGVLAIRKHRIEHVPVMKHIAFSHRMSTGGVDSSGAFFGEGVVLAFSKRLMDDAGDQPFDGTDGCHGNLLDDNTVCILSLP
jgi:hypothetical protein